MSDTVTEVTSRSWGSRLKGSFKGIFFGIALVALSCWLLFKNEGRAVTRYKALKEGVATVVSVSSERVDPALEGKLVHTTGLADPTGTLADVLFGISADAIHLERKVEMYQWHETGDSKTEKKLGGGTETTTTYSYETRWSEQHSDSRSFRQPAGHENPPSMPFRSESFSAPRVQLGAFTLSDGLIRRMREFEPHTVGSVSGLPPALLSRARLHDGGIYVGGNPSSPAIGDLRISYRKVVPATVSVVARQSGSGLAAHPTRAGSSIELLRTGVATADEMFEAAKEANKVTTWILRAVGFFMMLLGFRSILRPLSVLADVLPALGNLVEKGVTAVSFFLAAPLALVVIAFAWIFYRPLLAIVLLAAVGGLLVLFLRRLRRAGAEVRTAQPPPPPPPQPA